MSMSLSGFTERSARPPTIAVSPTRTTGVAASVARYLSGSGEREHHERNDAARKRAENSVHPAVSSDPSERDSYREENHRGLLSESTPDEDGFRARF